MGEPSISIFLFNESRGGAASDKGVFGQCVNQEIAIVGSGSVAQIYAKALETLGVSAIIADGDAMVLKGLAAARALTNKDTK